MKTYEVQVPDGRTVEVEGPDNPSPAQFAAMRERLVAQYREEQQAGHAAQTEAEQTGAGTAFLRSAGREFSRAGRTVRKGAKLATGQWGEPIREIERESAAEAGEFAPLEKAHPVATTLGSMAPYMAIPGAAWATPARAVATGAAVGMLSSEGDPMAAGLGAAGGPLGAQIGRRLARPFTPSLQARSLMNQGIQPSVGQAAGPGPVGSVIRRTEESLQSMPIAGEAFRRARRRAQTELTDTAMQRAVPKGETLKRGIPVRDAMENLTQMYSRGYDAVFKGRMFQIKPMDMVKLRQAVSDPSINVPPEARQHVLKQVSDLLAGGRTSKGYRGEAVKHAESTVRAWARKWGKAQDPSQAELGRLYDNAEGALAAWRNRGLPMVEQNRAKELDRAYANFKRVQRASTMIGAEQGQFSAASLQNAVRALDPSKDKARFARGDALMQDLSEPAKVALSSKVPDSGTTERMLWNAGGGAALAGATQVSPAAAAAYGAGTAAAWATQPRWMQRFLTGNYPGRPLIQNRLGQMGGVAGSRLLSEFR